MCTGGGSGLRESFRGSTTLRPPVMANQMRPSAALYALRLMADGADRAAQSVLDTVGERTRPADLSVGEVRQLLLPDAEHALAAGHPQVPVVVFDDAVHEAGKEPVVHRVGRELAILQSAQALAGANPQHVLAVDEQRLDAVVRQAVLRPYRR